MASGSDRIDSQAPDCRSYMQELSVKEFARAKAGAKNMG